METPPQQVGGVDPGLAALIAAILTGGVSAYGFSKVQDSDRAEIRTAVEENLKRQIGQQLREEANAAVVKKEEEIKRLQGELAQLKASTEAANAMAQVAAEESSDANLTFRDASPEALRAAIPIVLSKLAAGYPKIRADGSTSPLLKAALEYPASYSGRMLRPTLATFYRKRIEPALRMDLQGPVTGGRGRKRRVKRGGDMEAELAALEEDTTQPMPTAPATPGTAASYGSEYPNYEEFAPLYAEAIKEATQMLATKVATDKTTAKQTAEQKKKDAAAKKAAEAIVAKFEKAIKGAEDALDTPVPEEQKDDVREAKVRLSETLDKVRELVGMAPPKKKKRFGLFGGASNLREVATETEWNELNTPQKAEEVLKELQDATGAYLDAVKALPPPAPPAAPAAPEDVPTVSEEDAISSQTSTSEPGSATSIGNEVLETNPLFMMNRKKEARKEQEEELMKEEPASPVKLSRRTSFVDTTFVKNRKKEARKKQERELMKESTVNPIKKTKRAKFGGSRKRTLKKRRGGK